jgi:MFS family permease
MRELAQTAGWYPLAILFALNTVDELDRVVLSIFAPNIKRYFDIDNTGIGALVGIQVFAVIVFAVPIGYLGTKFDRARILRWSALVWSLFSAATALAVRLPLFVGTRLMAGLSRASVEPIGRSLLSDYYPPYGWNRVQAIYGAANPFGQLIGPAMAGVIGVLVVGDEVWRWGFALLTIPSVLALLASRRLREPENQMVRSLTGAVLTITGAPSGLSFREALGRLLRIPTFRLQLVGIGVLGFGAVGLLAFINILLEEEFGVGEGGRGLIGMVFASANLLGTLAGGNVGERLFERNPRQAMSWVGLSITCFSVVVGVGVFVPSLWMLIVIGWVGVLLLSIAVAPLFVATAVITPPRLRPLMFSLLGICIALFGGVLGGIFVGAVSDATNLRVGLSSVAPFGMVGGLIMARASKTIEADMEAVAEEAALVPGL